LSQSRIQNPFRLAGKYAEVATIPMTRANQFRGQFSVSVAAAEKVAIKIATAFCDFADGAAFGGRVSRLPYPRPQAHICGQTVERRHQFGFRLI